MAHPLRDVLPQSFAAFFGGFERVHAMQERAVAAIVAGGDVLLAAPTAAGKTEAFAAPCAERVLGLGAGTLRAVFVSPTRALANDLKRRLEGPFDRLGVAFGRYTGEHKERVLGKLPDVIVTTPEALDSLLARRSEVLREVRFVVLDEIHVLDGTTRGDQLRILLHRLDTVAATRPQRIAASATVADLDATAARYLEAATIVSDGTRRPLRVRGFCGTSSEAIVEHLEDLARHGFRKVLVFCNRRADVEAHAHRVRGRTAFGDAVFLHHGSLARRERERTERLYLHAPSGVLFCSMTLEMGIDIGSVDYVLLVEPPPGVASLLQRVGRGNRRSERTRAGYAYDGPGQRLVFRELFAAAAVGELASQGYAFRPSVLVQQALVMVGARGWIDAATFGRAMPAFVRGAVAPTRARHLLDALVEHGLLEAVQGRYVLSEKTEHRYRIGKLHSNIDSELVLDVVDRLTGDIVGGVSAHDSHEIRLGGRNRRIVARRDDHILTDPATRGDVPVFRPRGVPFVSFAFARRIADRLGCAPDTMIQAEVEGAIHLVHGLGTVGALLLQQHLDHHHGSHFVLTVTPFVARLARRIEFLPPYDATSATTFVERSARKLAKLCAMGPHHTHLPPALQLTSIAEAADLPTLTAFLQTVRLAPPDPPSTELRTCAASL